MRSTACILVAISLCSLTCNFISHRLQHIRELTRPTGPLDAVRCMSLWTVPRLNGLSRITRVVIHAPASATSNPSFATFYRPTPTTVRQPASAPHPQTSRPRLLRANVSLAPLPLQNYNNKYNMVSVNGVNGIKKEKVVIVGSGNWYVRVRNDSSRLVLTRLSPSRGSAIARVAGKYPP